MTKTVGRVSRCTSLRLSTGKIKYFGSVFVTETQEYSFSTKGILYNESLIKPGVFVVFELEHQKDKSEPEAINIELVTENSDLEILSICVQSNNDRVWYPFFNRYLELAISNDENKDQLIKLCIKKLNLIKLLNPSAKQDESEFNRGIEKKMDFLKSIPSILYLESKELRKKLGQLTKQDYSKPFDNIQIRLYFEPKDFRHKLNKLTVEAYFNIYSQIYQEFTKTEKIVDEVSKYITYRSEEEQNSIIHLLPNNLKGELKIFQSFKPKVQVDSIWDIFQADPINVWEQLSKEAKMYSLYRAFEEQVCIDDLIKNLSIEIVNQLSKDIIELSEKEQNTLIHLLPNNLKRESKIFQSFKPKVQVDFIWDIFQANPINVWEQLSKEAKMYSLYRAFEEQVCIDDLIKNLSIEIVNQLSKDIIELSEKEQNTLIHLLPNNLKRESKIFQSFKPKVQVDSIWNIFQADPINVWEQLSKEAKIYSLYRAFEEQVCIDNLINNIYQDDDALISFAINLFSHNKISFWEIHKSLLKLIINCQGKTSLLSPFFDGRNSWNMFSRPDPDFDYRNLDNLKDLILENFLYNKNVNIVFDDGTTLKPEYYIIKIKEWINFVRQNSDRLKCSYCQKFMNFDPKYTKYSKIYAITVFHCSDSLPSNRVHNTCGLDGSNHNYNVYINHCWKCQEAVDSRDSFRYYGNNYRDQGWVRCANCGAGKKPTSYW